MANSLIAQEHQAERSRVAELTSRAVLSQWGKVNPMTVARDWGGLLPRVTAMTQGGQLRVAQGTTPFLLSLLGPSVLEGQPTLSPLQFIQAAPDGRDLMGILAQAIPTVIRFMSQGENPRDAMLRGAALLDLIVRTTVADTGRQADQAAMVSNRHITSYVRVVESPACARCIVLAGKEYGVSKGFLRHPRCDCTMEPVTKDHRPTPVDPQDTFNSMSATQQRKAFGEAGTKAINDGADIARVVNSRKAMDTVEMHGRKVEVTRTGTNTARAKKNPPRLTPDECYKQADGNRDHAIRLLRKNGYIY
jgi:hypothetical protein